MIEHTETLACGCKAIYEDGMLKITLCDMHAELTMSCENVPPAVLTKYRELHPE